MSTLFYMPTISFSNISIWSVNLNVTALLLFDYITIIISGSKNSILIGPIRADWS